MNNIFFFNRAYRYIYAIAFTIIALLIVLIMAMSMAISGHFAPGFMLMVFPVLVWRYFIKRDYRKKNNIGFWIGKEVDLLVTNWGNPIKNHIQPDGFTYMVYEDLEHKAKVVMGNSSSNTADKGFMQEQINLGAVYGYSIFKFDGTGKVIDITTFLYEGQFTSFDAVTDWPKFMHDMRYINI